MLCCVAVLLALGTGATAGPPSPAPATVLLDGPLNATWAANHAEEWASRGFGGIILDGLALEEDTEGLTQEIRAAAARLSEAGLAANFMRLDLAPWRPWYGGGRVMAEGVARFAEAGAFCRDTGLRGIAVDLRPDALPQHYAWDGYAREAGPAELRAGAEDFGRCALRAYLKSFPEGEILLLATSPVGSAGPLWHACFAGMIAAPDAADVTIHVVLSETTLGLGGDDPLNALERTREVLGSRLGPALQAAWGSQVALGAMLEPIVYEQGLPRAAYPVEQWRYQVTLARLLSEGYCVVRAPEGGWWQVTSREAEDYAHLLQGGPAQVRLMPPPPRDLDQYEVNSPVADYTRLGPGTLAAQPAFLLRDDRGAAAFLPAGLPRGYALPLRSGFVAVTNVYTGTVHDIAANSGEARIPAIKGPLVVDRLPMAEHGLPACLWLTAAEPLVAGGTRSKVRFGFWNGTGAAVEGNLEAFGVPGYSLGRASFPLKLAPGETARFDRFVQGIFHQGDRPAFRLNLVLEGGGTATGSFTVPVTPARTWTHYLDAPLACAPVALLDGTDQASAYALAGGGGDLWLLDASGAVLAEHRFRGRTQFLLTSRVGRGTARAVAIDTRGTVRVLDVDGSVETVARTEGALPPRCAAVVEGRAVVLGCDTGEVRWVPLRMGKGWTVDMGAPVAYVLAEGLGVTCLVAGNAPKLISLDALGRRRWTFDLPAPPACEPLWTPGGLAVGLADGRVLLAGASADAPLVWCGESGEAPVDLAAADGLLVLTGAGVRQFDWQGTEQWSVDTPGLRLVGREPRGARVFLGESGRELVTVDARGAQPWLEFRRGAPVEVAPSLAPLPGGPGVLANFADGAVVLFRPQRPTAPPPSEAFQDSGPDGP